MSTNPQRKRKAIPYPLPEYQNLDAPDDYQEEEPQPIPIDISPRERASFRTRGGA